MDGRKTAKTMAETQAVRAANRHDRGKAPSFDPTIDTLMPTSPNREHT